MSFCRRLHGRRRKGPLPIRSVCCSGVRRLSIRPATPADLPSLDALQKQHGRALGYFPLKQFEGYVNGGHVLVAEEGTQNAERTTQNEGDAGAVARVLDAEADRDLAGDVESLGLRTVVTDDAGRFCKFERIYDNPVPRLARAAFTAESAAVCVERRFQRRRD